MECELHFQEGFTGDTVVVSVDGEPRARIAPRTRLQLGLAHIESVTLQTGQTIEVALPERGLSATKTADEADRWIEINVLDGRLVLRSAPSMPGYV